MSLRVMSLLVLVASVSVTTSSAGCLGLSCGGRQEEPAFYHDPPTNSLSYDQLLLNLGRPLRGAGPMSGPERAIDHLVDVKDKDAKVILGVYSVNELLALNQIHTRDLNEKELKRRQGICDSLKLNPEESKSLLEAARSLSPKYIQNLWSLEERTLFLKRNLFNYCTKTVAHYETTYKRFLSKRINEQLSKKDHANILKLTDIRDAFNVNQQVKGIAKSERAGNFKGFLEGRDKKELNEIRQSCKKLRGLIDALPIELDKDSRFLRQAADCESFL